MKSALFFALMLVANVGFAGKLRTVPSFSSQTQSGEHYEFDKTNIIRPTLIVFWATWCRSCRYEVPDLIELQKKHGKEVDIIAVNLDDNFEVAQAFIKRYGINYRNLKDERGVIADRFGIEQTPTFYVVDQKGNIVKEASSLKAVQPLLLSLVTTTEKQSYSRDAVVMGTEFSAVVLSHDKKKADEALVAALGELRRVEDLMTDWRDSELMQVNHEAGKKPVKVDQEIVNLLVQSKKASELTDGVFDVTYAPLGMIWDYNKPNASPPSADQIKKARALVDFHKLEIDEKAKTAFLKAKGMRVGLGGIAKGYAVERAAQIIKNHGIEDFVIRAGGDMYAHGTNNGKLWNVVIRDPRNKDKNIAMLPISNGAVSTSGDYERYFLYKGKRYAHIIDPRTGYPADKCQSVTVITKHSTMAEVLSKTVFILGPQKGLALIEKMKDVQGVIVDDKGRVTVTSGLKAS